MANFNEAIDIILKHEGGYVNDPKDPGGETKYGISKRAFPSLDIKNLTIDKAKEIYKINYWEPVKGELINHQILATNIFDFAVNAGVVVSVKTIQKLVNVSIDGKLGLVSTVAINQRNGDELNFSFTKERFEFYKRLCEKKPDLLKFLNGWKIRCKSFVKENI